MAMDSYDDTRQDHPSLSIPNAAYPDAPYRPGEGQQHLDTTSSLATSSPQTGSSQWSHGASAGGLSSTREDPPPPYAPRQHPSQTSSPIQPPSAVYSPLEGYPLTHLSPVTSSDGHGRFGSTIPGQPLSSPSMSTHSPSTVQHDFYRPSSFQNQQQQQHAHPQAPLYGYGYNPSSTASTLNGKPGSVAMIRRRKQRRLKICVIVMGVVFMFLLAIILGVALSIWKNDDRGGRDDHEPEDLHEEDWDVNA